VRDLCSHQTVSVTQRSTTGVLDAL